MDEPLPDWIEEAEAAHVELKAALGGFIVSFGQMESNIDWLIHELLELEPDTGQALTSAIINFSTRLDILGSLARDLESAEPHREALDAIRNQAIDLNSYRNWMLHDPWIGSVRADVGEEWSNVKRRMRQKGGERHWQEGAFTSSDIDAHADGCAEVSGLAMPIVDQLSSAREARKKDGQKAK